MRYSALLIATACATIGLGTGRPRVADAAVQTTCPGEAARTRNNVVRFLTSPNFDAWRQQYGMTAVNPEHLVLLTDAQQAAVCERLRNSVRPEQGRFPLGISYYHADGFYFVSTSWIVPEGRIWTGYAPLVILRDDLSYVNTFDM